MASSGPGSDTNYSQEIARSPGIQLNRWYWISTARRCVTSTSYDNYAYVLDSVVGSFILSARPSMPNLQITMADISTSGLLIYANGFGGFANGISGTIKGLAVYSKEFLTGSDSYAVLGQLQNRSMTALS